MEALLFPDLESPCFLRRKTEQGKAGDTRGAGVFLVTIAPCQFGLGAFIPLGLVCFDVGIWAEQTPVWPSLSALSVCLSG